jgi:hypothetical protein
VTVDAFPTLLAAAPPLVDQPTMAWASVVVLLNLFLLLAVATGMFCVLLWRETGNRYLAALTDWSRAGRFRLHTRWADDPPPDPLPRFGPGVRVAVALVGGRCSLVKFVVDRPPAAAAPPMPGTPAVPPIPRRRHVLVCPLEGEWPAVGLRPTHVADALVDLLALPVHLGQSTQRFAVCTADRGLAKRVSASSLRGLLPADVGLILLGRHLLLDFSDRPFDGIEFNRMIAVADQLVDHLPGK